MKNKIHGLSSVGDLIFVGHSRQFATHYNSILVVMSNYCLQSIKLKNGHSVIERDFTDFLEHENKPIGLFSFLPEKDAERKAFLKALNKTLSKWTLLKDKFNYKNKVDITEFILNYFKAPSIKDLEKLGLFIRLI